MKKVFFVEKKKKGKREKEENIWRRKISFCKGEGKYFFVQENKNRDGKGGKYLEKENIFLVEDK